MAIPLHKSIGIMPMARLAARVAKSRAWLAQTGRGRHMLLTWPITGRAGHTLMR